MFCPSNGNDFKSIDFKSRFQITFFIFDFDFKSLGDQWFVILISNRFLDDFDFIFMIFSTKSLFSNDDYVSSHLFRGLHIKFTGLVSAVWLIVTIQL